jgi:16S rRNA processing protein RimM
MAKGDLRVEAVRHQGKGLIAKLANIDDRTAAEALRGFEIRIPANSFPAPDDGDFYWRDLVGLSVWCCEDDKRVLLGTVDRLLETGANDVLVVVPTEISVDDKEHLIPWIPDSVIVEVDVQGGKIEVNWYGWRCSRCSRKCFPPSLSGASPDGHSKVVFVSYTFRILAKRQPTVTER